MVLADWGNIQGTVYDFTVDPSDDFTGDSAYAVYWNPANLIPGASRTYVTYYGLGDVTADLQPPLALAVSGPSELSIVEGQYSPNPFEVVTTVFNNDPNTTAVDNVELTLDVPAGLTIQGDPTVSLGTLQPGQEVQQSWQVTAANSATPVTLEYSVTATGNNTLAKVVTRPISVPASTVTLCTLTVKDPIDPSDVTQEAIDMMAYVDEANGLVIHSAPTINAVRGTSGSDAKMAAGVLKDYLAEGENAEVIGRVDFPLSSTDPDQIWYKIAYTDAVGDPLGEGWIIGFLRDDTNDINYVDEVPVDCSEDPAIKLDGADTITFYYDREAAARYGIAHSYRNSIPMAESQEEYPVYSNQATSRIDPSIKIDVQGTQFDIPYTDNLPYAYFAYNFLTGGTNESSSAVFNSEAIWMGGLPMTYNVDTQIPPQTDTITLCQDSKNPVRAGWRFCYDESGPIEGNGTWSWSTHQGLVGYYSDDPGLADNVVISEHGSRVAQFYLTTINEQGEIEKKPIWLDIAGNIRTYGSLLLDTNQHEFFDTFINPNTPTDETITEISQVRTGDYIFTERFSKYGHGYLIIGWGEIMSCPSALDMLWTFETPSSTQHYGQLFPDFGAAGANYVVPYVVDFPGSIDRGMQTQRPRPRPFYCADFRNPGHQRNNDGFAFYTFNASDSVTIPNDRLYVFPEWQWE